MIPARSQREVTIICPENGSTNIKEFPIYLPAVVAAQVSGKFDSLYPNHISFPSDPVFPNLSTLISPIFQANPCLSGGYPHRKNNKISKLRIISRSPIIALFFLVSTVPPWEHFFHSSPVGPRLSSALQPWCRGASHLASPTTWSMRTSDTLGIWCDTVI